MKKRILTTVAAIAMIFGTSAFIGCGGSHDNGEHEGHDHEAHAEAHDEKAEEAEDHSGHAHAEAAKYQCPMDCENGKTYDEMGTCPVCHMDLAEVTESAEGESHEEAAATYQCPMDCEKGKTYHEAGTCPVCKMDLKEVKA